MLRDCYTASVVVTTVAGFAASRVGTARETFLELAMRDFDLVVFDESDRVQKTLDHFFMPETSFNNYIRECAEDCSAYMKLSNKHREENLAAQRYDEMQRQSVTVLSCIVKSLHHELGTWRKITYGDPFSALTLLDDLYQTETEFKIPHAVYQAIYDLIDMQDEERIRQSTLWAVLDSSCKSTDEFFFDWMYQLWLTELGETFSRPEKNKARKIQDARIKLILRLIYFDHFIRGLSDAYEASHETSYGQNELFGFLQTRFRQQQHFLPSALCGNLFGLKKTDEEDMPKMDQIHAFAVKWCDKFRDQTIHYIELVDHYMADDCEALGFVMDCGNAFAKRYGDAVSNATALDKIIDEVKDISLLGSAIYSRWRYFNHWAYSAEEVLEPQNRTWFILALSRLAMLTGENPFIFSGQPKQLRIISNNIGLGPQSEPGSEVEQRMTITLDGQVFFSAYSFEVPPDQYRKTRTQTFRIEQTAAQKILGAVATYFSNEYDELFATDVGNWSMELTNTEGVVYKFGGALSAGFEVNGVNLSDLIRDALKMKDLYVFDGNPNRVD